MGVDGIMWSSVYLASTSTETADAVFKAHLHAKPCGSAGGGDHYQNPANRGAAMHDASMTHQNENWPTVECSYTGLFCSGRANSLWTPSEDALDAGLSIVVHVSAGRGGRLLLYNPSRKH